MQFSESFLYIVGAYFGLWLVLCCTEAQAILSELAVSASFD